jgi:hypothetical protein
MTMSAGSVPARRRSAGVSRGAQGSGRDLAASSTSLGKCAQSIVNDAVKKSAKRPDPIK